MIDKILKDWNDRVGGNLNHEKESHLFELGSMLWEQGWSSEQIGELVKNLKEQETKFKGRTKDGDLRYFKSKDSLDKALEKGTVEPVDEPDKKDEPEKDPTKLSGPKDFERPSSDDDSAQTDTDTPKDKDLDFTTKSEPTDGLFTSSKEGYKKIKAKSGKTHEVRQLKDENGAPIDTSNQEGREKAISIVRGRLEELKEKSIAGTKVVEDKKATRKEKILAFKWLGEYGEMEAYVDLLERGGVTDVYLYADSEPKNDLVVVVEGEDRMIDAHGVSVKTTKVGKEANLRGSSVKGDFIGRLEEAGKRNLKVDGVDEEVDAGVLLNASLELRKRMIKYHTDGKAGVKAGTSSTIVKLDGEEVSIAEFRRRQKITKDDINKVFDDDDLYFQPTSKGVKNNPIRGLKGQEVSEKQSEQLRAHFKKKFLKYVDNEDISHVDLEERLTDFISDVLEEADVDLIPEADMMVSYYDENGFVENGFITKEAQRKKIEEKIGPIKDMNRRDQVVNVLGLDFTGRGAGDKKGGTGHIDGQSFGRPPKGLQPKPTSVTDYVEEITK